jgi:hypothetical protein
VHSARSASACSAACLAAATLSGCGSAGARQAEPPVGDRQWRSNTAIIVRQLQADIAGAQISGGPEAARAALRDESSLYGLLVSYSDFAGCREMVAAAGPAPRSASKVDTQLVAGCRYLEHASDLFTQAVKHDDGASLLAAARESGRALPSIVRAAAALRQRK